jgi:hypothetical protein
MTKSLALVAMLMLAATVVNAQKGSGSIIMATVDTDACQNGARNTPEVPCTGGAWANGNLNMNNSQWIEGEYVPVRVKISALDAGSTGNTLTIDYDTTTAGKHTFDWLGDYDASAPSGPGGNDPCSGVTPCASPTSSPIPADSMVPDTFEPSGRDMTIWNGVITNISAPMVISGDYSGTSITRIVVTYNVNPGVTNVVIAFGAHVATRLDWGFGTTAIDLNGSPYHLTAGGGQVSMKVDATIFPAIITIIKSVTTLPDVVGGPPGTTSTFAFGFTHTVGVPVTPFSLVDDVTGPGGGDPLSPNATERFTTLTFGTTSAGTVVENDHAPTWTFAGITCTSQSPGTAYPTMNNNVITPGTRSVQIFAEEAEQITCTFSNTQFAPTAANAAISGRTVDSFGNGIGGTRVTLTNAATGESIIALTNPFGYYTMEAAVGNFYIISVSNKRYTFSDNTRTFSLNEELTGVDFVADPRF